ncbi:peptidoglycan DD-metalloendopeptidase family protein [Candidatus Thiodubiliella endoseptemdiera]|uniref:peptidoglycan DD-metalloendopeptidase family protein n=1 Tax=Candidatus Thiodubiliella endoseptemdiera TaxID=2738886 RepID=UPI0034DE97FF
MKKISLLLLLLSHFAWASIPVQHTPYPGGIAVFDFETTHSNPKAFYRTVPLYTQHIEGNHWQVLLGIPLLEKAGKKSITIQDFSTRTLDVEIKIIKNKPVKQNIKLKGKNKKYVDPNAAHMDRIKKERVILGKTRLFFSDKTLSNGVFIRPVLGVITSPFGVKRLYNGQPRNPHTGIDYAGATGTPIKAPADGKVILSGQYFFNGNTIFLDHGQGLISVYIHMDKRIAKQGKMVKKGETIGTIGQTGRATGPHLHWGVYLNRTTVHPNLLMGKSVL